MQKKINIVHIISNLSIGGAQILIFDILKNLNSKNDLNISVITIDSGDLINKFKEIGLNVIDLKLKNLINPKIYFRLKKELKILNPDIVHTHLLKADFYGRLAAKAVNVPVIYSTCHNDSTSHNKQKKDGKNFFDYIDNFVIGHTRTHIIAISKKVKEYLVNRKKDINGKIEIIYNGVDTAKRDLLLSPEKATQLKESLKINKSDIVICFPGRLEVQKGHKFFIDSFKDFLKEKENIKVLILGDGSLRNEINQLIKMNSLDDKIYLLGFKKNVEKYFEISDIIVLPSLWEGFGIVITEGMIKKKIVIASDVGGIPEIIKDNENGFIFKSGNKKNFTDKFDYVISNLDHLEHIRENAFRTVVEKFDIKKISDEYYKSYLNKIANVKNEI